MTRHNITDRFAVIDLKLQEIERFQGGGKVLLPLSPLKALNFQGFCFFTGEG